MYLNPSVCYVILLTITATPVPGQEPARVSGGTIRVVEGDGAINSIRRHLGHDPSVRVLDATGEPVAGATVTFLVPAVGASGTFGDSGLSLTVQTDSRGVAVGRGLKPNRIAGPFRIRVTSSWQGEAASASLTQTNAEPLTKSSNSKWIAIVALAGGAVAGGAVAATRGGKSTESAGISAASTIVAGNPSLGPPH